MVALGLIAGFALGAGCACALLFLVRKFAQVAGIAEKSAKYEPEAESEAGNGKASFEEQFINLLNYDGKPVKHKQVSDDED